MSNARLQRTREAYRRKRLTLPEAIVEARKLYAMTGTEEPTNHDVADYVRLLMAPYPERFEFDVPAFALPKPSEDTP